MQNKDKIRVTIYLAPELDSDLEAIAEDQEWSKTKTAERLLEHAVKEQKENNILEKKKK